MSVVRFPPEYFHHQIAMVKTAINTLKAAGTENYESVQSTVIHCLTAVLESAKDAQDAAESNEVK